MKQLISLRINKQPAPEKGDILCSEPFLMDQEFSRSVILICEHNEEGSFGLILNKKLDIEIHSIIEDIPETQIPIHIGGPVEQNQLFYLHQDTEIRDSIGVNSELFLGGDYNQLKEKINNKSLYATNMRFFIGYSGWEKGQLQREVDELSWVVIKHVDASLIFDNKPEELWKKLISLQGGKYKHMSEYPANPSLN